LPIAYGHKQQSNKIGSGQNGSRGGGCGIGGYGSGDSDGDGYGNDNRDGDGCGNCDSDNNNGDAGDDGVDGDNDDDGDDVGGLEEIGGCGGGSGEGGGDGCGNTLVQLPSVNDATFMTTMFLTRPTTSICCRASARGCPPTTNSIQHRINDDYIGR